MASGDPMRGAPPPDDLQLAEICVGTRALGPGVRSVAWVQGCPFHCQGCIAPDWIPARPARAMSPAGLAAEMLSHPLVTGFTFSGGEPMSQAGGLAEVIALARRQRELTLICFTGYRLAELRARAPSSGVAKLLAQTDVLIDGRYVAARNSGRGLRGSDNQQIHFLTDRLADAAAELAHGQRRAEIRLSGRSALLVGVPGRGVAEAFRRIPVIRSSERASGGGPDNCEQGEAAV
jgi:anaerobic ribonucleoside-triphosphate reductase activating protein